MEIGSPPSPKDNEHLNQISGSNSQSSLNNKDTRIDIVGSSSSNKMFDDGDNEEQWVPFLPLLSVKPFLRPRERNCRI
ncbi:hypothetical protein L6452_10958 [Arctium lappa]|uniref:Uncharacterized protein n=1 Tax=Arctium lappa TaxID=4217 RepID=A0ACB9DP68_ARCLA|nr:hypothetical protein L6452_10958 [Arctium lappa]